MTTNRQPCEIRSLGDEEEISHEALSRRLIEVVEAERQCVAALDLERLMELTEERMAITREVIALARHTPVPPDIARDYVHIQREAQRNFETLQSAQNIVRGIMDRLTHSQDETTYGDTSGRTSGGTGSGRSLMVWKG